METTYSEYKDSGIKWIGEIPSHWSICKFKHMHDGTNVGEAIDKKFWTDDENDLTFYTAGLNPIYTNFPSFPEGKFTKENDLLMARNGTPYVYVPNVNSVYTDHVIRTPLRDNINRRYAYYVLSLSISHEVVDTVSLATWSASLWNAQSLPLPPLEEQNTIASYLDDKCEKIDALVNELEKQIEDLKAYKQSVISEAVTGKIRITEQN